MLKFEIEFLNSYGHIIYSFRYECKTEKQATTKAKKKKKNYVLIAPGLKLSILKH